MRTYQNGHNMLLTFPRCLNILLLQISKTDNNALDIDAIYNLKIRKSASTDSFTTKLNAKFPCLPLCQKKRECILQFCSVPITNLLFLKKTLPIISSYFCGLSCSTVLSKTYLNNNNNNNNNLLHSYQV
jgi:hypothetical protein